MTYVEDRVIQAVSKYTPEKSMVRATSELIGDLGYDELDNVMLLIDLEDEFDLEIDDAKFEECKTVGDVIEMVRQLEAA